MVQWISFERCCICSKYLNHDIEHIQDQKSVPWYFKPPQSQWLLSLENIPHTLTPQTASYHQHCSFGFYPKLITFSLFLSFIQVESHSTYSQSGFCHSAFWHSSVLWFYSYIIFHCMSIPQFLTNLPSKDFWVLIYYNHHYISVNVYMHQFLFVIELRQELLHMDNGYVLLYKKLQAFYNYCSTLHYPQICMSSILSTPLPLFVVEV